MLHFGTGGIPLSAKGDVFSGIEKINELGLSCMELEFVYQTWLKPEDAEKVKNFAKQKNIHLTAHGSYYINLNSEEKSKIHASINRIIKAAEVCEKAGVKFFTFHPAFYMRDSPEQAYSNVKKALKTIIEKLNEKNIKNLKISLETTGKQSQFGTVDEIISLSKEFNQVFPCIDFAHIYARSLGKINSEEKFQKILDKIKKELGKKALNEMHIHMSGIEFGKKGEKNHTKLEDSDFNYKKVLKVLKKNKVSGYVICESPVLEQDAKLLKKTYTEL